MSRSAHPAGPRHADVLPEGHYSAPPADLNTLDPKVWAQTVTRNDDGVVTVGGIDVTGARRGVRHARLLPRRGRLPGAGRAWRTPSGTDADVFYAGKAFLSRAVVRWLHEEGLNLDVCSGGELATALSAGMPADRIAFHGNNKSADEIRPGRRGRRRADRARLLPGDRPRRPHRAVARQAAAGADPRHRRRRGAHARVHRHRPRGPEVRDPARRRAGRRGRAAGAQARRARTHRHPLAHRVADLRHVRLRGRRPPGRRAAQGHP